MMRIQNNSLKTKFLFIIFILFLTFLSLVKNIGVETNSKITSISCGYYSCCYTNDAGELFVQGVNSDGQFGNDVGEEIVSQKIKTDTKVTKAILSLCSLVYIDEYNDVYIIGIYENENNNVSRTLEPRKIDGLSNIVDVKAGAAHFLALDNKGNVWSFGENDSNQVSMDNSNNTWLPQKIEGLTEVKEIECGYYTSCAVTEDAVFLWGEDCFGLTENDCFDDKYILNISNVQDVSIGRNHMVVLSDDGVIGYGSNSFGQFGKNDAPFIEGEFLDIDSVDAVYCSITSTIFLIEGQLFYLGDIDPFDEETMRTELTIYEEADKSIDMVNGFCFRIMTSDGENVFCYDTNIYSTNNVNTKKVRVALLDTGVDDSLSVINDIMVQNHSKQYGYKMINRWNCCDGSDVLLNDALTDSHGTGMFGLIADISLKNGRWSYDSNIEILPIKVIDTSGGKFVDILIAIEIIKILDVNFVNCSFSIDNLCYQNVLEYAVSESNPFFIFAINNNSEQEIMLDLDNVLYVGDLYQTNITGNNIYSKYVGKVEVVTVGGNIIETDGNSCATAIITHTLCDLYNKNNFELNVDNVVEQLVKVEEKN